MRAEARKQQSAEPSHDPGGASSIDQGNGDTVEAAVPPLPPENEKQTVSMQSRGSAQSITPDPGGGGAVSAEVAKSPTSVNAPDRTASFKDVTRSGAALTLQRNCGRSSWPTPISLS